MDSEGVDVDDATFQFELGRCNAGTQQQALRGCLHRKLRKAMAKYSDSVQSRCMSRAWAMANLPKNNCC